MESPRVDRRQGAAPHDSKPHLTLWLILNGCLDGRYLIVSRNDPPVVEFTSDTSDRSRAKAHVRIRARVANEGCPHFVQRARSGLDHVGLNKRQENCYSRNIPRQSVVISKTKRKRPRSSGAPFAPLEQIVYIHHVVRAIVGASADVGFWLPESRPPPPRPQSAEVSRWRSHPAPPSLVLLHVGTTSSLAGLARASRRAATACGEHGVD